MAVDDVDERRRGNPGEREEPVIKAVIKHY